MDNLSLDTTMTVDLVAVNNFIESDEFVQFLLNNNDFPEAAFILQTLHESVKILLEKDDEDDSNL